MHNAHKHSQTHQRASMAQSQTCPRRCACRRAACQTPDPYRCLTGHPQHPRNGNPGPDRPHCRRRKGNARWRHHDNAASALHSLCLHSTLSGLTCKVHKLGRHLELHRLSGTLSKCRDRCKQVQAQCLGEVARNRDLFVSECYSISST